MICLVNILVYCLAEDEKKYRLENNIDDNSKLANLYIYNFYTRKTISCLQSSKKIISKPLVAFAYNLSLVQLLIAEN